MFSISLCISTAYSEKRNKLASEGRRPVPRWRVGLTTPARLLLEHADLAGVGEQPPGVEDGGHLPERLEPPAVAGRQVVQDAFGNVDPQLVPRTNLLAQPVHRLEWD